MIRTITKHDILKVTSMSNSSIAQNNYLKKALFNNEFDFNSFYIYENDHKVLARAVVTGDKIRFLTFEDELEESQAVQFLNRIQLSKYQEVALYKDKLRFQFMLDTLLLSGFQILSERTRFELETFSHSNSKFTFKDLNECDSTLMKQMFIDVQFQHLDPSFNITGGGEYFDEMYALECKKHLWTILFIDDIAVGFIIFHDFDSKELIINYIGVLPKYRGNNYVSILLQHASDIALKYSYTKIIAEIDNHNFPLRNALENLNYIVENELIFFDR